MGAMSEKGRIFVLEPIGDKPVTAICGIGETYGKRLSSIGYDKAYTVLGQYLLVKKNDEIFTIWLQDVTKGSPYHISLCIECLQDWISNFL